MGRLDEAALNAPLTNGHGHNRRRLIAEAKDALGAVLTGERVYLQKYGSFAAADTNDLRVKLGVYLDEPSLRWTPSAMLRRWASLRRRAGATARTRRALW